MGKLKTELATLKNNIQNNDDQMNSIIERELETYLTERDNLNEHERNNLVHLIPTITNVPDKKLYKQLWEEVFSDGRENTNKWPSTDRLIYLREYIDRHEAITQDERIATLDKKQNIDVAIVILQKVFGDKKYYLPDENFLFDSLFKEHELYNMFIGSGKGTCFNNLLGKSVQKYLYDRARQKRESHIVLVVLRLLCVQYYKRKNVITIKKEENKKVFQMCEIIRRN